MINKVEIKYTSVYAKAWHYTCFMCSIGELSSFALFLWGVCPIFEIKSPLPKDTANNNTHKKKSRFKE